MEDKKVLRLGLSERKPRTRKNTIKCQRRSRERERERERVKSCNLVGSIVCIVVDVFVKNIIVKTTTLIAINNIK